MCEQAFRYPEAMTDELWVSSRSGSHAGRGFHYQDAVATELAIRAWRGELPIGCLVPEGLEDVSVEFDTHWLHLQAKSRREYRGQFTLAELTPVWRHLAKLLAVDRTARAGLVLERPLMGAKAGLERSLADGSSEKLKSAVAATVAGLIDADDFLARTHVVVMPCPEEVAIGLLADRLGLPPASCVAHQAILRGRLAGLADENGVRSAEAPAALSVGDMARLFDDVSEAIDPSALDEAVREGVAELVDFATAIHDERFFSGVDVVVGHVVAGLPMERPEVEQLADGLAARRVALAVGPSGAGKSALIWLTAYASRHRVRWYRVRRLQEDDVPALVRLVKGLRPSGAMVGLVVDDLGRDDRAGFDRLVEELREQPAAFVLGACREEDLFVARTARGAAQVRPSLGPELAKRIWGELRAHDATSWREWREAYARSEGLLLEYGHLLTEGTRLEETVAAQVEQRVREQRALELEVLALVATADAFGAEVDAARLAAALVASSTQMKAALARLVDEHLIREHDGLLGGLHELRSRYLMEEVHRLPPTTLADSVRRGIDLLASTALQPFLTRLLLEASIADDVVIDAVAARLQHTLDPRALAAALQALRLVGFRRMAAVWREILAAEDAAPTNVGLITHFALHGGDYGFFPQPIQRAVARIRDLELVDLRGPLLERIAPQIPAALAGAPDVRSAATVLAALGEVGQTVAVDAAELARLAGGASLADLRLLLEAAYATDPKLAVAVADALGGSAALLDRLEREQPWVRNAHLDVDDHGRATATAEWAYVAESAQPKAHDAVVELARYLAALAPAAEVAVCRAIDATGRTAGLGTPLADKAIDRRNLPSQAAIAWNRARGRAAVAAVAASTETEYLLAAREIVVRSTRLVRRAGEAWVRGKPATQQLYQEAIALAEAANQLAPPPIAIEAVGPLEEGELPLDDPVSFVGTMIPNNLFVNLFKGEAVAPLIPQIVDQVDKAAEPERWRLLDEPPAAELAAVRQVLLDLHAVAAERARGDRTGVVALTAAGKNGLTAAAKVARQRAGARMQRIADRLEDALANAGFSARVLHREGEPDSYRWPSDDFLILIDVSTIYHWLRNLETLANLCRPPLEDRIGFLMAPVRDGRVVASSGVKVIDDVFPDESVRDWPELPLPLLEERLADSVRRGLTGLQEASGIIASVCREEIHDDEIVVLQAAVGQAREALQHINGLADERDDQLLLELVGTLLELSQRVEDEAAAFGQGQRVDRSLAASVVAGLTGKGDDVFFAQVGMVAACVEWDVEPDGAWVRVDQALKAIDSN
jgi:hypothetical protein